MIFLIKECAALTILRRLFFFFFARIKTRNSAKIMFCQIYVTEINDYKRKVNCLIQVKQNYNMPYSLIITPAGFPHIIESKIPWHFPDFSLTKSKFPWPKHRHLSSLGGNVWAWLVKQRSISSKCSICLYLWSFHQNPFEFGDLWLTVVLKCLALL